LLSRLLRLGDSRDVLRLCPLEISADLWGSRLTWPACKQEIDAQWVRSGVACDLGLRKGCGVFVGIARSCLGDPALRSWHTPVVQRSYALTPKEQW